MIQKFAVVHEAEADFQTATDLADRVLIDSIDWLENPHLPGVRDWVAEDFGSGQRLTWKAIARLAREAGIPARGAFDGEPGKPDADAARRAIRYLRKTRPELHAILLIRDQDDQPERRQGLEQARRESRGPAIIIGLAVVE
jgi:hypothetical protein